MADGELAVQMTRPLHVQEVTSATQRALRELLDLTYMPSVHIVETSPVPETGQGPRVLTTDGMTFRVNVGHPIRSVEVAVRVTSKQQHWAEITASPPRAVMDVCLVPCVAVALARLSGTAIVDAHLR
jgi:hypothetical protein